EHVRRLASEGIRPRLPWGMTVPALKKSPELVLPVLEKLVNDSSEYVRRSVANNLNDISKTHPELVLKFVSTFSFNNPNTARLVKHALRGLLKKGHPEALALFGFNPEKLKLEKAQIQFPVAVNMGEEVPWNFKAKVKGDGALRLEYIIHYQKANGSLSPKVFQLRESQVKNGDRVELNRKQAF